MRHPTEFVLFAGLHFRGFYNVDRTLLLRQLLTFVGLFVGQIDLIISGVFKNFEEVLSCVIIMG